MGEEMATARQIEAAFDFHPFGFERVRLVEAGGLWAVGPTFIIRPPAGYVPKERERVWHESETDVGLTRKVASLTTVPRLSGRDASLEKNSHPTKKCTGRYVLDASHRPIRELGFPLFALFRGVRASDYMLDGAVVYGYDKTGGLQVIAHTRPPCSPE